MQAQTRLHKQFERVLQLAIEWANVKICVRFIYWIEEWQRYLLEIVMLSHHENFFSSLFCQDSKFVDVVQSVFKYSKSCSWKERKRSPRPNQRYSTGKIAPHFMHGKGLTISIRYTCVKKDLFRNSRVHRFVKLQSNQESSGHDRKANLNDLTLFMSISEDSKVLLMATVNYLNVRSIYYSFPAHNQNHRWSYVAVPHRLAAVR